MNPYININIQVAEIEAKMTSTGNMKYVLTATDKKKYHFYQKNKNKETGQPEDCDVFKTFNNMGVKKDSTIAIGFTEEEKTWEKLENGKKKIIPYTDRFIGSIREASGVPVQTPTQAPKAPVKSNLSEPAYVPTEFKPRNFKQEGYEKCLWGYFLEKKGIETLTQQDMDLVWTVFNQIEKDAEKRFNGGVLGASTGMYSADKPFIQPAVKTFGTDEVPTPTEDPGEIDGSQIPF